MPLDDVDATDLDAVLSAAMAQHSEPEAAPEPEPVVEAAPEVEAPTEPSAEESAAESRARDEAGRFAKAQKESKTPAPRPGKATPLAKPVQGAGASTPAPAKAAQSATAAPAAPVTPAPEPLKPPQSWKPAAREKWAGLPVEVQQEAHRLDREIRQGLQESADARKNWDGFRQAAQPYEAMFRAQGQDPVQAASMLFQAQYILTHGTAQQKAQGLANLISQSGVELDAINAHLSGQAPQAQAQQQPAFDPQRFKQELLQEFKQQSVSRQVAQDIQQISKAEFYADVREDMADIVAAAARRGVEMTAQQAYDRACQIHPEVSGILAQRAKAQAVNATQASTQRALNAASSVRSSPASGVGGKQVDPKDLDAVLQAAWAAHSGQ